MVDDDPDYSKERKQCYKLLLTIAHDTGDSLIKHEEALAYGMSEEEIEYLISTGFLKEIEVERNEAISISLKNRYGRDSVYAARVAAQSTKNLEKAWDALAKLRKDPNYKDNLDKARYVRSEEIRARRRSLEEFLRNKFGELPERISPRDVAEILKEHLEVLWRYPEGKDRLYICLRFDLRFLGINTNCRGERVSKSLRKKLKEEPDYREATIRRANKATEMRKKLYKENPEIERSAYEKSAETRKRMMKEDKKFRENVLRNLSLGNPALWEKYRTDEKFRKRVREKQLRGLRKGTRTRIKRAKRRRNALMIRIIGPNFGDPFKAKPREIEELLNTKCIRFRDRYYKDTSLYRILKTDLSCLRTEQKELVEQAVLV